MGSRPSRPSNTSSQITGPPYLPFDIYLEVLRQLRPSSSADRRSLCALALCCRTLRDAAQRILFSTVHCENQAMNLDPERLLRLLGVNLRFLAAVVDSPDRLALFVTSYSQHWLGLDPKLRSTGRALSLAYKKERVQLWNLTERSLPLMVNLKELYFTPSVHHPSAPLILQKCTFQLDNLTWTGVGSEEALYSTILPTQRALRHLDINSTMSNDRPTLPDGLCPALTSVACTLADLAHISAQRPIVALHVVNSTADIVRPPRADGMEVAEREPYLEALGRIRYLRLLTLPQFQRFTSGITLGNVVVLEIWVWQVEDTRLLAPFPELRFLRLRDHYPIAADESIRRDTASRAFAACSKLEEVLIVDSALAWQFLASHRSQVETMISFDNQTDAVWRKT